MLPSEHQSELINRDLSVIQTPAPKPSRKRKGRAKARKNTDAPKPTETLAQESQDPTQSDNQPVGVVSPDSEYVYFVTGEMEYPVRKTTLAALQAAGWTTQEPQAVKPARLAKAAHTKAAQAQSQLLSADGHSKQDNGTLYGNKGAGARHLQSWASGFAQHIKQHLNEGDVTLAYSEGENPRVTIAIISE